MFSFFRLKKYACLMYIIMLRTLRRIYTLRIPEPAALTDALPVGYDIFIRVRHDRKEVRVEDTMRDYCEQRVVVPRIRRVFRDLYPDYDFYF